MSRTAVLVVDDDRIVLESCKRVLEAEGYEVHLVPGTDEALAAMDSGSFELLLIDVKMPKRDGMYLMRRIKETRPELPIIVMSGFATPETMVDGMRMGARAFIAKPFTPDELQETVCRVLGKERRDETNQSPGH